MTEEDREPSAELAPVPPTDATPAVAWGPRSRFAAPRLGSGRKAIIVLAIVLGVTGIGTAAFLVGRFLAGDLTLPGLPGIPGFPGSGIVTPGTVAFGTSSDLSNCSVQGQTTSLPAGGQGVWIESFSRQTTFADEVRLRISVNATQRTDEVQDRGIFTCLGTEKLETDLTPGTYLFEVLLNGRVDASGSLFVR